jgi:nucleotide-binding universal stress UspA family protein
VSEERPDLIIRRILVGLDASPHSLAALEAATELAARFRAELLGLFVEDINLLRASELPFTREVRFFSGALRRLDTQQIERQLRAQAARARRALTASAGRSQVSWSFRVTRGTITSELLDAASEMDLIILGKSGWSPIGRRRLGSTARALLSDAPRLALILEEGTHVAPPVAVIYDGSPLAQKALVAAAALAQPEDSLLLLLILAEEQKAVQKLQAQAAEWLQKRGLLARYYSLTEWNVPGLAHMLETERAGTLVLPAQSDLLQDDALLTLLDEIEIPILCVR